MGRRVGARARAPGRQQDSARSRVNSTGTLRPAKRQLNHTNEPASDFAIGSTGAQHQSPQRDIPAGHNKRQYQRLGMPTAASVLTGSGINVHAMGTNRASCLDEPTDSNKALEMKVSAATDTEPNMNLLHPSHSHGYGAAASAGAGFGAFSVLPGDVALLQAVGCAATLPVHEVAQPAKLQPRQRATDVARMRSPLPAGNLTTPGPAAAGTLHPGLEHRCALCMNLGRLDIECLGESKKHT